MRAAHCAFIFSPPSSTNSVSTGSTAKIADRPSESETGLKSCVYTESPPSLVCERIARPVERGNSFHVRVALFVTCLGDTLFPSAGQAVVRLLDRLGTEVEFPEEQTCC